MSCVDYSSEYTVTKTIFKIKLGRPSGINDLIEQRYLSRMQKLIIFEKMIQSFIVDD